MTTLFLDPFSGIAGDMLVGALIDLGATLGAVREGLSGLPFGGYELRADRVTRRGFAATKFDVVLDESHDDHRHSRGLAEIRAVLDAGDLAPRVHERSLAAFMRLAEAEARAHGKGLADVHFHEVGAVDAICDIVGACIALEELGIDRVLVGTVHVGSGFVSCAHGTIPVPAPATMQCLTGFSVRLDCGDQGRGELVTPTGACLLAAVAEPAPAADLVIERVGYGAGTRDPDDVPNLLRAMLCAPTDAGEELWEVRANVDHAAPTVISAALEDALAAGAVDVFVVPCTMKKGRPGHLVTALVDDAHRADVEQALFAGLGTLGVRRSRAERSVLSRRFVTVETPWGEVPVKLGERAGDVLSAVPEFDDCRRLAQTHGVALQRVIDAALSALTRTELGPPAGR